MLLSTLLFDETDRIRKTVFGICFSMAIFAIMNFFNHVVGVTSATAGAAEYAAIAAAFFFIYVTRKKATPIAQIGMHAWIIIGLAALGSIWKWAFLAPIKHLSTAYDYADMFAKDAVPDLGFYTGMASDHANYISKTGNAFWLQIEQGVSAFGISLFLMTLAYLGFVYILTADYSESPRKGLFAAAVMSLAPFEIFYTSGGVFGHPIAYIAIFTLFYFFMSKKSDMWARFALAGSACLSMSTMYYTSTMANIIVCAGFCLAILLEKIMARKRESKHQAFAPAFAHATSASISDGRTRGFIAIGLISAGIFFAISNDMIDFTDDLVRDTATIRSISTIASNASTTVSPTGETLRPYRDPNTLGISAIRAEAIIFIIFGLTFVLLLRNPGERERRIFLASIPAALGAFAFIYAGYPARAFDYFAFFGLTLLTVPCQAGPRARAIAISATLIAIALLGTQVMRDKRMFFSQSDGEIAGAAWIAEHLDGRVFSDQAFINLLIQDGYHDVTGTSDTDPRLTDLFYADDKDRFMAAIGSDFPSGKIRYFVTTTRMREKYILMLNTPQIPISNEALIDMSLEKLYDNGDVRIYSHD